MAKSKPNPFGPLPIDPENGEPVSIVNLLAENLRRMSDEDANELLRKAEADIEAQKRMAGARAALESVFGLLVRVLT
jgi:F0F1-type ATP synthase epsilon subunit